MRPGSGSTSFSPIPILSLPSQPWYFDHANDDKSKTLLMESMIHEEKKHFPLPAGAQLPAPINLPKVSPMWSKEDVESLRKGIVSLSKSGNPWKWTNACLTLT